MPDRNDGCSALRVDMVFPRFKLLSGAERLILEMAAALVALGHRPRLVCHQFHPSCEPLLVSGVEVAGSGARLDFAANRYVNAVADYVRVRALNRLLDRRADARVYFGGPSLPLAWYQRCIRRDRAVQAYHCFEPPRVLYQDRLQVLSRVGILARLPLRVGTAVYRKLDRCLVRSMDVITTAGCFAAQRAHNAYGCKAVSLVHGVNRERLDAGRTRSLQRRSGDSTPGANTALRHTSTRRDSADGEAPLLLTVNYLHPRKRVNLILEAMAQINRQNWPLRKLPLLRVIGDGPERGALEELAQQLEINDRVHFTGFVPDEQLPQHYWQASCYVHATHEETFGLSVIEASYCEVPIVAVDEGGVRETVQDTRTGFLVEPTAAGLADGIIRVFRCPDEGREMGRSGRAWIAAGFRWEQGAAQLIDALRAAARAGRGSMP